MTYIKVLLFAVLLCSIGACSMQQKGSQPLKDVTLPEDTCKLIANKKSIGLVVAENTTPIEKTSFESVADGVVVANIIEGSPADSSGLEKGDVIYTLNKRAVLGPEHFAKLLYESPDKVTLTVSSKDKSIVVSKVEFGRFMNGCSYRYRTAPIHKY